jgi:hypothetical protein
VAVNGMLRRNHLSTAPADVDACLCSSEETLGVALSSVGAAPHFFFCCDADAAERLSHCLPTK